MGSTNEGRYYNVTSSLIDRVITQTDPDLQIIDKEQLKSSIFLDIVNCEFVFWFGEKFNVLTRATRVWCKATALVLWALFVDKMSDKYKWKIYIHTSNTKQLPAIPLIKRTKMIFTKHYLSISRQPAILANDPRPWVCMCNIHATRVTARFVTRFNLWLRHDLWPHNASICDPARFVTKSASICDQRHTIILESKLCRGRLVFVFTLIMYTKWYNMIIYIWIMI